MVDIDVGFVPLPNIKFVVGHVENLGEMVMGGIRPRLFELFQRVRVDFACKFGVSFCMGLR